MTGERTVYVLRFDYPDGPPLWAGRVAKDGSLGWAPTILTAMHFDSAEAALRMATNGYGPNSALVASAQRLEVEA